MTRERARMLIVLCLCLPPPVCVVSEEDRVWIMSSQLIFFASRIRNHSPQPPRSTDHGRRVTDRTNLLPLLNLFITETLRVNLDEPLPY